MTSKNKLAYALIMTSLVSLLSLFAFTKAYETGQTWRIVCSGIGFGGFLMFSILIAFQWFKINKGETQSK